MIVNGQSLLEAAPIKNMLTDKYRNHGVSYGLTEAGYDIRITQEITFHNMNGHGPAVFRNGERLRGNFVLASAMGEFQMPNNLIGRVCDKSTWARRGLSVFNTVIEPGWNGFLTLELVYHGSDVLHIPAGAGIAQILFSRIENAGQYSGKYQDQADKPVAAILE